MPVQVKLPGYSRLGFFRNVPVRVGVYTGICLSAVFSLWVVVANRVPLLDRYAMERNAAAVVALCFFATVPILRFYRDAGDLLASGLLGWSILTVTYRILSIGFGSLAEKFSAVHVFVLGAIAYLIAATLAWILAIILRVRAEESSHTHR